METRDVDLEGGLISVPGGRESEGRMLWLEAAQVLALHLYLSEHRPALLRVTGKATERLFLSRGSGQLVAERVGAFDARVADLSHVVPRGEATPGQPNRVVAAAVRVAGGAMAGHRYVSSTERYRAADLDALHEALVAHHPLSQVTSFFLR